MVSAQSIVQHLVEDDPDSPDSLLKRMAEPHPVYTALAKYHKWLEGEFDGVLFTISVFMPSAADFDKVIEHGETLLSAEGKRLNQAIKEALQRAFDEMTNEETVDANLRQFNFDAEGFYFDPSAGDPGDPDHYTLSFDQLDDAAKANARSIYYEWLFDLDWWTPVYEQWEARLNSLGFLDVEFDHDYEEGVVSAASFISRSFDFKRWATFGSVQPLDGMGVA